MEHFLEIMSWICIQWNLKHLGSCSWQYFFVYHFQLIKIMHLNHRINDYWQLILCTFKERQIRLVDFLLLKMCFHRFFFAFCKLNGCSAMLKSDSKKNTRGENWRYGLINPLRFVAWEIPNYELDFWIEICFFSSEFVSHFYCLCFEKWIDVSQAILWQIIIDSELTCFDFEIKTN